MIKGALSKEVNLSKLNSFIQGLSKVDINTQKLIKVIHINRQEIRNMIILVDIGKHIKLNIHSWLRKTARNLVIEWKFLNQVNRIYEF